MEINQSGLHDTRDPSLPNAVLGTVAAGRLDLPEVLALQDGRAPAWDPHDVWLNRVKKPREAQAER